MLHRYVAPYHARTRRRQFEDMALAHIDSLYRTALRMTGSREHAEDLVQETFLRAYRAFERFDGHNARAWLFTILRNTYISQCRHNDQSPPTFAWESPVDMHEWAGLAQHSAEDELLVGLLAEDLERALTRLSATARMALLLAYVEELSYAEIAQIMHCPVGTVMSRLYRARRLLEELLRPERASQASTR